MYRACNEARESRRELREISDQARQDIDKFTEQVKSDFETFQMWKKKVESIYRTTNIIERRFELERITAEETLNELTSRTEQLGIVVGKLDLSDEMRAFANEIVDLEDMWLNFVWATSALTSTDSPTRAKAIFELGRMVQRTERARRLLQWIKDAGLFEPETPEAVALEQAVRE